LDQLLSIGHAGMDRPKPTLAGSCDTAVADEGFAEFKSG
jgi:hypothetical protein